MRDALLLAGSPMALEGSPSPVTFVLEPEMPGTSESSVLIGMEKAQIHHSTFAFSSTIAN